MPIARIAALSAAIPKEQVDIMDLGFDADTMRRTMKLTGVHAVRYAPMERTASDYCLRAAQEIFDKTEAEPADVDGIIFATPHPDYSYPGNSSVIQSALGIPKRCITVDMPHACTGMIYGFYLADLFIRAGDCKNVLVCCGDTSSHHLNPKDRAMRMVIGDGGAAALVTGGGSVPSQYAFHHDGDGLKYLYTPASGERMPRERGVTDIPQTDAEENVRTLEDEYMDGMEVMRFVMNEVPPRINEVLDKSGWTHSDVDVYALHQANDFILKSLARAMKLDKHKVLFDIDGTGNIGGASLVLALCHAAEAEHEPWERAVLAGFGSGLSAAAMTTSLAETRIFHAIER